MRKTSTHTFGLTDAEAITLSRLEARQRLGSIIFDILKTVNEHGLKGYRMESTITEEPGLFYRDTTPKITIRYFDRPPLWRRVLDALKG